MEVAESWLKVEGWYEFLTEEHPGVSNRKQLWLVGLDV